MPASKRHKQLKKFRFNCNRKRLGRVRRKGKIVPPVIPVIKAAWDEQKTVRDNVSNMGLCFDVNTTIRIPRTKEFLVEEFKKYNKDNDAENTPIVTNSSVVSVLEEEANALREKRLALPHGQVMWLSYLIDKYGDDYKAMSRDCRNLNQETWKQIRAKIMTFKSIPSQWNTYVASKQTE